MSDKVGKDAVSKGTEDENPPSFSSLRQVLVVVVGVSKP